jgi:predicted nucleic acid-binding protein
MTSAEISSTPGGSTKHTDVVVDASAWVSRVLPQDLNHDAARTWLDKHLLGGGRVLAPALLATEVAAAVSRRTGQPTLARGAVNQLQTMPGVHLVSIDQVLIDSATNLAAHVGLRGADALYVAQAQQLGIPLVTFDAEQLARTAGIIITIRP